MAESPPPALPWARPAAPPCAAIDAAAAAGLVAGPDTAIEVLWQVGPDSSGEQQGDEPEEEAAVWWPATLSSKLDETDGEGRPVYALTYAPDAAAGYDEPTVHRASFLDARTLYDAGEGELMLWRRRGDAWEPDAAARAAVAPLGAPADAVFRLDAVAAHNARLERLRGRTADEECADMLAALPPDLARTVAAGFADFSAAMSAGIAAIYEEKGEGYVLKGEDIEEIKRRFLGGGGGGGGDGL